MRYEQFLQQPLQELQHIYQHLGFTGFHEQEANLQRFVDEQGTIKTSTYQLDPATKQRIDDHWQFAFHAFDYPQEPI